LARTVDADTQAAATPTATPIWVFINKAFESITLFM
jgi:hypothetical protein